jgi:hypothetical protein
MRYKYNLIKIGGIAGNLYTRGSMKDTIVVYGKGAPIVPDFGEIDVAPAVLAKNVDLFVPDYIGFGRSDGMFTPMNCINTFLELNKSFKRGCTGINYGSMAEFRLKYKRVVNIGASFGGRFLPLLPKFDKSVKEIGILYSAMDVSGYGNLGKPEEKISDFMRVMRNAGYYHMYRGITSREWKLHLANRDDLAPVNNIKYLKDIKVFLAHGMLDDDINYMRSKQYYDRIVESFPEKAGKTLMLKLYKNGGHGSTTAIPAVKDYLRWIGL